MEILLEQAAAQPAAANLRIVLVGTQHPGNIGAAARAMKTMGLSRLVLVAPEKPLDEAAFRRSLSWAPLPRLAVNNSLRNGSKITASVGSPLSTRAIDTQ